MSGRAARRSALLAFARSPYLELAGTGCPQTSLPAHPGSAAFDFVVVLARPTGDLEVERLDGLTLDLERLVVFPVSLPFQLEERFGFFGTPAQLCDFDSQVGDGGA
jgi:hypothetical protein